MVANLNGDHLFLRLTDRRQPQPGIYDAPQILFLTKSP